MVLVLGHVLNAAIGRSFRPRLKSAAIDPFRPLVTWFRPHLKTRPKKCGYNRNRPIAAFFEPIATF